MLSRIFKRLFFDNIVFNNSTGIKFWVYHSEFFIFSKKSRPRKTFCL